MSDVCCCISLGEVDVAGVVQWALAEAEVAPRRKPLPWSEGEDEFLRRNLGILSEDVIGATLKRTPVAVCLRWKRDLGLPAPSKTPGCVTANQAADMLAVDVHAVCRWIEEEWLPARLLPFRNRKVWRIREEDLKRFAIEPEHWILFRPGQVCDPTLARLVALAVERWDDEWLTPGQVAEMHGADHQDVNRHIRAGKLAGVKWGNWWIRRSDAERAYFPKGRGTGHELDWSEEGDAFLVLARAVGLSMAAISRQVKWPHQRVGGRLVSLHRTGQIPLLIGKYGLEGVQYRREDGRLLAGWHLHRGRFPTLARAMDRFVAGQALSAGAGRVCPGCVVGLGRVLPGPQAFPGAPPAGLWGSWKEALSHPAPGAVSRTLSSGSRPTAQSHTPIAVDENRVVLKARPCLRSTRRGRA